MPIDVSSLVSAPSNANATPDGIVVENLWVRLGAEVALWDCSLSLGIGQVLAVLGPNGWGKTTLLRTLAGIITQESGVVQVFGQTPSLAAKAGMIAFVPQRSASLGYEFPCSVNEVMATAFSVHTLFGWRVSRTQREIISQTLTSVGLAGYENRLLSALSGGQRQRVFLARALASGAKLLLLDEPFSALDPASEEVFYSLLSHFRNSGGTVVFSSHDVGAVSKVATSVCFLAGSVRCQHDASHLAEHAWHTHWHERYMHHFS